MNLALDTSTYIAFMRDNEQVVKAVQEAAEVMLPLVVLAELRAGFEDGTLTKRNEDSLQHFLNKPTAKILIPNEETTFHYARLWAYLRRKKIKLPPNYLWIAALVLQHNCVLLTYDAHFDHFPQIPRW